MEKIAYITCGSCKTEMRAPVQPLAFTVLKDRKATCTKCGSEYPYDNKSLTWRYG